MLLSAVSVLVVAQLSSEIPEGLMNNPVFSEQHKYATLCLLVHPADYRLHPRTSTAFAAYMFSISIPRLAQLPFLFPFHELHDPNALSFL
jgi:hypothetical protein